MSLTPEQQKAAHSPQSVCVTAGAGTGKTYMLAARYLYHLEQGCSPLQIVAMTFTNQSATELRARIRQTVLQHAPDRQDWLAELEAAPIGTFHALAGQICRTHPDKAGVAADFTALDEWEGQLWIAEQLNWALDCLPAEIYDALPYSLVRTAMECFLGDRRSASLALTRTQADWLGVLEATKQQALRELIQEPIWQQGRIGLSQLSGQGGDKMETARQVVLAAMTEIESGEDIATALTQIATVDLRGGSGQKWGSKENLTAVKAHLKTLKQLTGGVQKAGILSLSAGELDQQIEAQLPLLQRAFDWVDAFLAEAKYQQRILDFHDLEVYALRALGHSEVQHYYGQRWQVFLLDEFQDTNPIQSQLLERLTHNATVTLVGDEKQSIYGFRRADIQVFQHWRQRLNNNVALSTSFRSHQPLVTQINQLFAPVLGDLHQALVGDRQEAPHPSPHLEIYAVTPDPDQKPKPNVEQGRQVEAQHIAAQVQALLQQKTLIWDKKTNTPRPIQPRDIAVLARSWSPLESYGQAIAARHVDDQPIPVVQTKGGNLLESRVTKDAVVLLQFLADHRNDLALIALLRSPFFTVSDQRLAALAQGRPPESWWQTLQKSSHADIIPIVHTLKQLLQRRTLDPPTRLLQWGDRLTGYTAILANLPDAQRRLADWRGVIAMVRYLEAGMADCYQVVRRLQRLMANSLEIPRPPLEVGNAVSLMTIHAAKGLEWSVVIVPDLSRRPQNAIRSLYFDPELGVSWSPSNEEGEKQKPALFSLLVQRQKQRETEEAKRILYVALTRARDRLILTAPQPRGFGLDLLQPGIENNFDIQPLPYPLADHSDRPSVPESPLPPIPPISLIQPIAAQGLSLPVTALTDYARCPKRFQYCHLEGHPGFTSGETTFAREIGILTHKVLETDVNDPAALQLYAPDLPPDKVQEALMLARVFLQSATFQAFQTASTANWEKPLRFEQAGITFNGKADLVGDDFVLEIKTEQHCQRDEHRFQLWAYTHALQKNRALLADLRGDRLDEFSTDELRQLTTAAAQVIRNIGDRHFDPTPATAVCQGCPYQTICPESICGEDPVRNASGDSG